MSKNSGPGAPSVAIVGGGAFGSMVALSLAAAGRRVTLYERQPQLMQGASYNNQNRLHLGFHYPRDDETARQCLRGFSRFVEEFEDSVLSGFPNAYFIASEGSRTSPDEFRAFCHRHQLATSPVDLKTFDPTVRNVELGLLTQELVYDSALVRAKIANRLSKAAVTVSLGDEVLAISRGATGGYLVRSAKRGEIAFDAVVNCSYANINRFTVKLGHTVPVRQYEYTAVAIVDLGSRPPVGVTIMDGPFMTLLPFGRTGKFLLYHVEHVVIARDDSDLLDPTWLDKRTSPFASVDKQTWFEKLIDACSKFVPALKDASLMGFLEGPRMVLANRDDTDARPSIVKAHEEGYITVFSGKIDHCIWVAEDIVRLLQ